jgi:nucleotide-binding universal stress UspA family protein
MTKIVIGMDESETAAHALRWATREGQLRQQGVTAVLAWGLLNQHHPDRSQAFDPHYDESAARHALHAYVTEALGEDAAAGVRLRPVNDLPDRALVRASHDASLLVLGGRGLSGFRGMVLGAVAYHALHRAACPVAIVREPVPELVPGEVQRIVVGVDGSETSHRALQWAVEEARVRHAGLEVVHSWNAYYGGGAPYGLAVVTPEVFEEPAKDLLEHCLDGIELTGLEHPVKRSLVCSSAAQAVLAAAKGADLVVLGSRGTGGFAGLLLGSTTTQVVHHAECPVVVIPAEH